MAVGGGAAAGDEGAGGAVTCIGFTFRGRSDVLQVPLRPCRDTRTVIVSRDAWGGVTDPEPHCPQARGVGPAPRALAVR